MGRDRAGDQVCPSEAVRGIDSFQLTEREVYRVWIAFLRLIADGCPAPQVITRLRGDEGQSRAIDYFAFLGMNLFSDVVEGDIVREGVGK